MHQEVQSLTMTLMLFFCTKALWSLHVLPFSAHVCMHAPKNPNPKLECRPYFAATGALWSLLDPWLILI
jgi:hypothetical protein